MAEKTAADYGRGGGGLPDVGGGATFRETAEVLAALVREIQRHDGTIDNPKQKDIDFVDAILSQIDASLPQPASKRFSPRDGTQSTAAAGLLTAAPPIRTEILRSAT